MFGKGITERIAGPVHKAASTAVLALILAILALIIGLAR